MTFQSNTILVAIELSNSLWLVDKRLPGARKSRMYRLSTGDTTALLALINTPICAKCFDDGQAEIFRSRSGRSTSPADRPPPTAPHTARPNRKSHAVQTLSASTA